MEMQTQRMDLWTSVGEEEEGKMNGKGIVEAYTLPYVKQIASGNLLYDSGNSNGGHCDSLEGWRESSGEGDGKEVQEGGGHGKKKKKLYMGGGYSANPCLKVSTKSVKETVFHHPLIYLQGCLWLGTEITGIFLSKTL